MHCLAAKPHSGETGAAWCDLLKGYSILRQMSCQLQPTRLNRRRICLCRRLSQRRKNTSYLVEREPASPVSHSPNPSLSFPPFVFRRKTRRARRGRRSTGGSPERFHHEPESENEYDARLAGSGGGPGASIINLEGLALLVPGSIKSNRAAMLQLNNRFVAIARMPVEEQSGPLRELVEFCQAPAAVGQDPGAGGLRTSGRRFIAMPPRCVAALRCLPPSAIAWHKDTGPQQSRIWFQITLRPCRSTPTTPLPCVCVN
jgi:hypothetical protein